ncbi:hypothetical protein [Delftia deserti]|uniref:Uncharacterized protein n=1 Tax=Delftia deserti TaxID=1651218 RepID=A0ABW5EJ13_9BURK
MDERAVLHQPDLCGASKPCTRLREVMVPSVLLPVKDVAKPARKSAKTGLNGEESGSDARAKNPIRSMTNVENQAPASMWRMSVAPMMDWIDL